MISVLIPTYNRPKALEISLPHWLLSKNVFKVIVVAEASSTVILDEYLSILQSFEKDKKLVYIVSPYKLGSIVSRNKLLQIASEEESDFSLIADDDFVLEDDTSLDSMVIDLKLYPNVGAVGGNVTVKNSGRIDPDFFLNLPINVADTLTRLTGYIFLDTKHGPTICSILNKFFRF